MMKRGEIRWYKFSHPVKKRPVLILTRDTAIEFLHELVVVYITSMIRDIPSEIVLHKSDGMPRDCAINFDHIYTVEKNKLGSLITTLSSEKMLQAGRALSFALGF